MTDVNTYDPVRVTHTGPVEAELILPPYSTHFTKVIQPGGHDVILPQDPDRYRATIMLVTPSIYCVLSDSQEASEAAGNVAASAGGLPPTPAGAVISSAQIVREYDGEVLYVTNCDTATAAYVSAVIERRR